MAGFVKINYYGNKIEKCDLLRTLPKENSPLNQ